MASTRIPEVVKEDLVELHERAQKRPLGVSSLEYFIRRRFDPVARELHDTGEVQVVRIDDKTIDFAPVIPERVGHLVLEKTVIPLPVERE